MYFFIGGPPTSGKSHLTKKFIENSKLIIQHVKIDDIRKDFKNDLELTKWVNFFRNTDEEQYWKVTTPQKHVENIINQSKALWPAILTRINKEIDLYEHIIFEGVNILPEFARKYLNFDGFYLIPPDIETIYMRLEAHSRWGKTNDLKRKEAKAFYEGDTKFYLRSAKEYGFKVFNNIEDSLNELGKHFYK